MKSSFDCRFFLQEQLVSLPFALWQPAPFRRNNKRMCCAAAVDGFESERAHDCCTDMYTRLPQVVTKVLPWKVINSKEFQMEESALGLFRTPVSFPCANNTLFPLTATTRPSFSPCDVVARCRCVPLGRGEKSVLGWGRERKSVRWMRASCLHHHRLCAGKKKKNPIWRARIL